MTLFNEKIKIASTKGLVDSSIDAEKNLVPKILSNNKGKQEKVIGTLCEKLEASTSFKFSVAFTP